MEENKVRQTYYNPSVTPKVTIALVAINVILFVLEYNFLKIEDLWDKFGIGWDYLMKNQWYRLFSAMFTHASIAHLGSNMIALYGVGMYLEEKFGSKRFLIYYLLCGILGELLGCFFGNYILEQNYVSAGASGAVFGLFGILIILSLRRQMFRIPFVRILLFIALSAADALTETGIDIFGHAGGFLVGIVIGLIYSFTTGKKAQKE
ncbi:MAG: rhomboid family intramembrane serine protease [Lachnospiraceae bacterium]|nr:rhomboid family intramembrane serine protease [Lachnospiraceae bacterium]